MRRLRVLAAVALAAAAGLTSPATAARGDGGPVVVPVDGTVVTTPFTTDATSVYVVTVTGAYSYNGRQNLADCGWWNPEDEGDAWYRAGFFLVNGATAECFRQPYTSTHTYWWTQQGTGAPFTFQVGDVNPYDNVGALVVEVVEVRPEPKVKGNCDVLSVDDTEMDVKVLQITARATASGGALPPRDVWAECHVMGPGGASIYATGPGPAVAMTDVVVLPGGEYQVCGWSYAFWGWYPIDLGWAEDDIECRTI